MRNAIFLALVAVFVILAVALGQLPRLPFPVIAVLGIAFGLLGLLLVVLTARRTEAGLQKIFFTLAGASAAGIPLFAVLHNLVYGLFIVWFGKGFWERHGMSDEPVFFVLAILVCPALFLIGVVGGVVLLVRARIPRTRPGRNR